MQALFAFLLLALLASAAAFSVTSRLPSKRVRSLSKLSMADEKAEKEDGEDENSLSFNMNRIVRLGRSRDQVRSMTTNNGKYIVAAIAFFFVSYITSHSLCFLCCF